MKRKVGSGKKKEFLDPKLARKVIRYATNKPNATLREIAQKYGCSHTWVDKVLKRNGLRSFAVQKAANRNDQQAQRAKTRARKLYDEFLRGQKRCVVMDDETYVVADFRQLPGRSFYRAFHRFGVAKKFKYQGLTKFPKKHMVWQAICSCGRRSKFYIARGTMKSATYLQECLQKRLLPFLNSHNVPPLFWPDLASVHYSRLVLQWYQEHGVQYVPVRANPPNCPQLRPVETFWALIKQKLRKTKKVATNESSFRQMWIWATKKVDTSIVTRLMAHLPTKVRLFANTSINDDL